MAFGGFYRTLAPALSLYDGDLVMTLSTGARRVHVHQKKIARALVATRTAFQKGEGVNSIVRILSLTSPAALPDVKEADRDPVLQLIRAELSELRHEIRRSQRPPNEDRRTIAEEELLVWVNALEWELEEMQRSGVIHDNFALKVRHAHALLNMGGVALKVAHNLRRRVVVAEATFEALRVKAMQEEQEA